MSDLKYCPSCGDPLNPGSARCTCGWKAKSKEINFDDPNHGRCAFFTGHERCPLPGTIAETTRADKGTPFYCRFHAGNHDHTTGGQILERIKRGELRPNRADWREELIQEKLSARRAA